MLVRTTKAYKKIWQTVLTSMETCLKKKKKRKLGSKFVNQATADYISPHILYKIMPVKKKKFRFFFNNITQMIKFYKPCFRTEAKRNSFEIAETGSQYKFNHIKCTRLWTLHSDFQYFFFFFFAVTLSTKLQRNVND